MSDRDARRIVFHGSIVLLIGLVAGVLYGESITASWGDDAVRGWRNAHLGLTAGGVLLLAVAGTARYLALGASGSSWLAGSLILTVWAAVVGLGGGPVLGVRGLEPTGPAANLLVFAANGVLAVGSLLAVGLLIAGSRPGAARR